MCKVILGRGDSPTFYLWSTVKLRIQQLSSRVNSLAYLLREPRQVPDGVYWHQRIIECPSIG